MARYSCFGNKNEKNTFGVSRNSRFAGIETKTRKVVNCSDDLRNEIIRARTEENRRETIMALAKAM